MGPINYEWCKVNGNGWAGGRIDVRGIKDDIYGTEIGLPVMKVTDWNGFSEYLSNKRTRTVWKLSALVSEYEKKSKTKITWFDSDFSP